MDGKEYFELIPFFKEQTEETDIVGRVCVINKGSFMISIDNVMVEGKLPGRFHYQAEQPRDFPAVGDWVIIDYYEDENKAMIRSILQRKTLLSRKKAGPGTAEQIMTANVDTGCIVTSVTSEFNLRRIERYIQQVYESGAKPVIVCTKIDLCANLDEKLSQLTKTAPGIPVYPINNMTGEGISRLLTECKKGETISLIGSSGVGKSSLINRLLNKNVQATQEVRQQDERGRHTTTHRELFALPMGAWIIDTPGMRELQLWGDDRESLSDTFSEIDQMSKSCKFRDCKHENEPGCAVRAAITAGEIEENRLTNFNKLKRELHRLELKEKYGTQRTNRMLHGPNKGKFKS